MPDVTTISGGRPEHNLSEVRALIAALAEDEPEMAAQIDSLNPGGLEGLIRAAERLSDYAQSVPPPGWVRIFPPPAGES